MTRPSPDNQRLGQHFTETAVAPQLEAVAAALQSMRYGMIQLTVHDGKLVQLDITERRRFAS